jgi:hypothetical protein
LIDLFADDAEYIRLVALAAQTSEDVNPTLRKK